MFLSHEKGYQSSVHCTSLFLEWSELNSSSIYLLDPTHPTLVGTLHQNDVQKSLSGKQEHVAASRRMFHLELIISLSSFRVTQTGATLAAVAANPDSEFGKSLS